MSCELNRRQLIISSLATVMTLTTTPAFSSEINFTFEFDLHYDDQHAVILQYEVFGGNESLLSYLIDHPESSSGFYSRAQNLNGIPPTRVWVQWRDLVSNQVFAANADINGKVPMTADGATVYLMVYGAHLNIFLISRESHGADESSIGPKMFKHRSITQIYSN